LNVLKLKGTPYEIGIQHGKQITELVRSFFSLCFRSVREISEGHRLNTLYNVEEGLQVYYPESEQEPLKDALHFLPSIKLQGQVIL
jgi:hypothetical protein